jgi:hypothetical protein
MNDLYLENINDDTNDDYTLTPEQEIELDERIRQSYDPNQLVPHEEVMKMMRAFLKE